MRRIHADTPEAIHKFCVASEGETEFNRGVIQDGVGMQGFDTIVDKAT